MTLYFPDAEHPGNEFGVSVLPQHYMRRHYSDNCFYFAINPACQRESGANLGMVFMASVFVEFDRERKRLGFAPSPCALPRNFPRQPNTVTGTRPFRDPATSCTPEAVSCGSDNGPAFGILPVISGVLLGLAVVYFLWSLRPHRKRKVGASAGGASAEGAPAPVDRQEDEDVALLNLDEGPRADNYDDPLFVGAGGRNQRDVAQFAPVQ